MKNQFINDYIFLNNPESNHYYIDKVRNLIRFQVDGLHCSSCVHLLEQIPKYNSNCTAARVFFGESKLEINFKDSKKLSDIAELIKELGYTPHPLKINEDAKNDADVSQDLRRLVVAGACASQIMIFSFAIYFGADGILKGLFRWASLVLFLPVLFYSAAPFYKGAWNTIKHRVMHIDLPIVIALWMTTGFSIWHFVNGVDDFYFDSTAGFIFLILCARFLVKRTQKSLLSPQQLRQHYSNQVFQLENGQFRPAEDLENGNVITLRSGQSVPADSTLLSASALFDTSMMNGESRPLYFSENLTLLAGYKLISENARLKVNKNLADSELSNLIENSFKNLLQKNDYINKSDKLAQLLLAVVMISGLAFFIIGGSILGYEEALRRVLALMVVACPCALAFGSPLTLAMAFRKAQSLGITIRNPDVFEKLANVKHIFFDKTGTLTEGVLKIDSTWPEVLSFETKTLIIELEKISKHPVAFALREAWSNELSHHHNLRLVKSNFTSHVEYLGSGISAEQGQDFFEIKALSDSIHSNKMAIELLKNKVPIARVYFNDPLRPEARALVDGLKDRFDFFILSGDRKNRVLNIAQECGISADHIYWELYPEDKEDIVKKYKYSMMIGDGLNDTLALSKSDVGVSMSTAHDLTIGTSDITFLRGGLKPLVDLFTIQKRTLNTLNRNLALALLYNSVAGVLALAGLISPLTAAILMPISTGIVVVSCYWGYR